MQFTPSTEPPLIVDLHGQNLAFQSADPALRERFETVYGHLPLPAEPTMDISIEWQLHPWPTAPTPPADMPTLSAGDLVSYYGGDDLVAIRLPKYGLITVDLRLDHLTGAVTQRCLDVYGAFEDVLMISLAPLYRRRGWFPLHAFAAQAPNGQVALITGEMGSGKTTTGLSLLNAGWKLLSNDSPLLTLQEDTVQVLAYPGRLSAFDDSLARFENLKRFIPTQPPSKPGRPGQVIDLRPPATPPKRVFRVEEVFVDPWGTAGIAGGVFFPQVVPGLKQSELVAVSPKEAVLALLPQAIEGWDKAAIGQTLQLLRKLVEQAPCYVLRLAPHVDQLPGVIARGMAP